MAAMLVWSMWVLYQTRSSCRNPGGALLRVALYELSLDNLVVIYPGPRAYPLAEHIAVLPLSHLAQGGHALIAAWGG
jgi:hypothetical protein